ncbi:MAG: SpoIIE family protein phosphatase [bacterium]|nr:SpoIIE family protein phosphatase [bacterium]
MEEIYNSIYINFLSFGALVTCFLLLLFFIFLTATKNKSTATIHFSLICFWQALLNFAYFLGFTLYTPAAAYHRWLTVFAGLCSLIHLVRFYFYFPDPQKIKFAKILFRVQYIVSILVAAAFILRSFYVEKVFYTNAEFWSLREKEITLTAAVIILIYMTIFIIAGIWRVKRAQKEERSAVLTITLCILAVVFFPVTGNLLAKAGILDKYIFHLSWYLVMAIGWLTIFIVYLNIARDKISFVGKVAGITHVSLIVLLILLAYFILRDRDRSYTEQHRQLSIRMLVESNYRPHDFSFLKKNPPGTASAGEKKIIPGEKAGTHFIVFTFSDPDSAGTYDVGFSYTRYRQYIHTTAMAFVIAISLFSVIGFAAFSIFIDRVVWRPIKLLLTGFDELKKEHYHIQMPVSVNDEMGYLISNFNTMARTMLENKTRLDNYANNLEKMVEDRTEELQEAHETAIKELEMARKIQYSLLPAKIPDIPGISLAYTYEPMMMVGGDFIDILFHEESNYLGLFICDVIGHGVPAAFLASMTKMALANWDSSIEHPGKTLVEISSPLVKNIGSNFISALICSIDLGTGKLISGNAGHPPLLIARHNGGMEIVYSKGSVISDLAEPVYEEVSVSLHHGDYIILYTDGVTEAANPEGTMLTGNDYDKLCHWVRHYADQSNSAEELCRNLYDGVISFCGRSALSDDIAILVVQYWG